MSVNDPIADLLTRSGIGTLGIIDYDKVSLSNIHRQSMFNSKDIGKYKVDVVNSIDIAKEKASIYDPLNEKSFALIPNDSEYSKLLIRKASKKTPNVVLFGTKENSDASFKKINKNKFIFSLLGKKISLEKKSFFKYWEENTLIILIIL